MVRMQNFEWYCGRDRRILYRDVQFTVQVRRQITECSRFDH